MTSALLSSPQPPSAADDLPPPPSRVAAIPPPRPLESYRVAAMCNRLRIVLLRARPRRRNGVARSRALLPPPLLSGGRAAGGLRASIPRTVAKIVVAALVSSAVGARPMRVA